MKKVSWNSIVLVYYKFRFWSSVCAFLYNFLTHFFTSSLTTHLFLQLFFSALLLLLLRLFGAVVLYNNFCNLFRFEHLQSGDISQQRFECRTKNSKLPRIRRSFPDHAKCHAERNNLKSIQIITADCRTRGSVATFGDSLCTYSRQDSRWRLHRARLPLDYLLLRNSIHSFLCVIFYTVSYAFLRLFSCRPLFVRFFFAPFYAVFSLILSKIL